MDERSKKCELNESFLKQIRHSILEEHILLETLLNNVLANYFCDNEDTKKDMLFFIFQKESSFKRKLDLLENLKLYGKSYINCGLWEYKKGIKSLKWVNNQRNNISHNFMYLEQNKGKILVNVVKRGKVNQINISRKFIEELNKKIRISKSILSGLFFDIGSYKGTIKEANK